MMNKSCPPSRAAVTGVAAVSNDDSANLPRGQKVTSPFGHVWERLGTKRHEKERFGTFGHVWAFLGTFGNVSARLGTNGNVWAR